MTLFNFALILAVLTLQAQCFPPPQEILSDGSSGNVVKVHDESAHGPSLLICFISNDTLGSRKQKLFQPVFSPLSTQSTSK